MQIETNQMLRLSENIEKFKDRGQITLLIEAIHDFGWDDVNDDITTIEELNKILECGIEGLDADLEDEDEE